MTRNLPSRRYEMPPPRQRGLGPLALAYLVLLALVLGVIAWAVAATPGTVRTTATLAVPPRSIALPEPARSEPAAEPAATSETAAADTPSGTDAPRQSEAGENEGAEAGTPDTDGSTPAETAAPATPAIPVPVPRPGSGQPDPVETAAAEPAAEPQVAEPAAPPPPAIEPNEGPTDVPDTAPASAAAGAARPVGEAAGATQPATPALPASPQPRATTPQTALAPPAPPGAEIELATVDPALSEAGADGPLPVVAADGRQPWQAYRRPYRAAPNRPVVALMVSGLGLSAGPTQAAIQDLPPQVSLAFMPYAPNLDEWVSFARAAGHEVFVNLPMEPYNYPQNDPGEQALLTSLSPEQNLARLRWTLSRFPGYVGVTNYMGSLFTTEAEPMRPVLAELKSRGLMFFDNWPSRTSVAPQIAGELGLPYASSVGFIDLTPSSAAIRGRLDEVARIARETGYAAAIGLGFPLTVEVLGEWANDLESQGITLVPVSAMVEYER